MNKLDDRFLGSTFDEVDYVLDTDERFHEAMQAANDGDEELVDILINNLKDSGEVNDDPIEEDQLIQYNPEDDDAIGILDTTAEDYRQYVSEEDYDDEDGEIIDCIANDEDC